MVPKKVTGVQFWNLSAAFDILDSDLLIQKHRLYGCSAKTCQQFNSFLMDSKQMVKIRKEILTTRKLRSGIPQGSILYPIIFTIYCTDLEELIRHSKLLAMQMTQCQQQHGKQELEKLIENLKEDATNTLQFMAYNRLAANPSKKEFMLLNDKQEIQTGK